MLRLARDQGDILLQGSCFDNKASLIRTHPTLYTYAPYSQQDECTKLSQKRPGRFFEVSMNLWVDHHPDGILASVLASLGTHQRWPTQRLLYSGSKASEIFLQGPYGCPHG